MKKRPDTVEAFKTWLIEHGAIIDAPTNEWELLRVRTCDGVFVAYRNKTGKETWPDGLLMIQESYLAGRSMSLSPDLTSRKRLRHLIDSLIARDGQWRWFCEVGFLSPDSNEITIEHLVAKHHGGPDHISNIVIACEPCNREAAAKSVAEKVAIRDRKRGFICEPARASA